MFTVLQILLLLTVGYGGIVLYMYYSQEAFLFFPVKTVHQFSQPAIESYTIEVGGVHLHGWLVNPQYKRDKLIIYYGGNAEDVFQNVDEFEAVQAASLFVSYRGYGQSEGNPGERELFGDALNIFDDMVARHNPEKIFLMGRSLGSGVACYVGANRQAAGLILVTPYDSITRVAQSAYPWLPVAKLLKHKFDSTLHIAKAIAPILILYAGEDRVVRPERTRRLIDFIRNKYETVLIPNADHGTIDMFPQYWSSILSFIQKDEEDAELL